jgi:hypothetical protein
VVTRIEKNCFQFGNPCQGCGQLDDIKIRHNNRDFDAEFLVPTFAEAASSKLRSNRQKWLHEILQNQQSGNRGRRFQDKLRESSRVWIKIPISR